MGGGSCGPRDIFVGLLTLHCGHSYANARRSEAMVFTRMKCEQVVDEADIAGGHF